MGQTESTFRIDGMTCGGCEKSVVRAISSMNEVVHVDIDRSQNKAVVRWASELNADAERLAQEKLCACVEAAGFECRPI
jgi:copper chaperone